MAKTGSSASWHSDWKVQLRVRIERQGEAVLGEGRAELMAALERERSITQAAKSIGMSYRRAWSMIQDLNAAAGEPLVEAAVGGKQGGGAQLTPRGRAALAAYEQVRQSLVDAAAGAIQRAVAVDSKSSGASIHVAAAISLQESVGQILAEYALVDPTVRVRTIFGASNELADHLLAGAPGDLFLSAEPAELDRLESAGLVATGWRRVIAQNGLAIVGAPKAGKIHKPADLLAARFKRVAIAESACPLGQYSQAYLQKARVHDQLAPKLLEVNNSRAVLAAVVSGAAQAGVAFASDAGNAGAWQTLLRVPIAQAAATYEAAMIGRGKRRKDVQALCDFLSSATAEQCYRRCGLRIAKS